AVGGVRVGHVTGVQTSALPVSAACAREVSALRLVVSVDSAPVARVVSATIEAPSVASAAARAEASLARFVLRVASAPVARLTSRSEERRVGKEGRSGRLGAGET